MAKPDIDDGWLKYAHELDAAIACADFTKPQRKVLRYVFAQIYGPAKLPTATLLVRDVATDTGIRKPHVCRAIKELIESNVLLKHESSSFSFVKDYERWTKGDGRPRLDDGDMAFAKNAVSHAMSYKHQAKGKALPIQVTNQQPTVTNPGNATDGDRYQSAQRINEDALPTQVTNVTNPRNVCYQSAQRDVFPPLEPPVERARVIQDLETGEEEKTPQAPQTKAGRGTQDPQETQPAIESEPFDSGQSDPMPPPVARPRPKVENDPVEVVRLISKASQIFPNDFDIGPSVSSAATEYRAEWISEALDIAREKKANAWVFVRRVLTRFKAQGASDSEKSLREWEKKQVTSLWNQPSHVPAPDPKRPPIRYKNSLSDSEILQFREIA